MDNAEKELKDLYEDFESYVNGFSHCIMILVFMWGMEWKKK